MHAWAAWRVYKIEKRRRGKADREFLERVFHKLLLNFTWWVNRKDPDGMNVFEGGFLGLDNIGVFDRSEPLPTGGHIEQSDGTSWMAMYCLNMLAMAMELARQDPAYEDVASKFFEHFVYIAQAMNNLGGHGIALVGRGRRLLLRCAAPAGGQASFSEGAVHGRADSPVRGGDAGAGSGRQAPRLQAPHAMVSRKRPRRSRTHRRNAAERARGVRRLLSIVSCDQLVRVLRYMLDEEEFLSPYGVRGVSKFHRDHPYVLNFNGQSYRVDYEPGESQTGLFGGNSNWRGPVWFPLNFLLIETLQKFHYYYQQELKVECPAGSGRMMALWDVAAELSRRLTHLFLRGPDGRRPVLRRKRNLPDGPALAELASLPRVFSRRQRSWPRGQPPDRLDGAGGEADPAERGGDRRNACVYRSTPRRRERQAAKSKSGMTDGRLRCVGIVRLPGLRKETPGECLSRVFVSSNRQSRKPVVGLRWLAQRALSLGSEIALGVAVVAAWLEQRHQSATDPVGCALGPFLDFHRL